MVDHAVASLDILSAQCLFREPQQPESSDNGFGTMCYGTVRHIDRGSVPPGRIRAQQDWDVSPEGSEFGYGPLSDASITSTDTASSILWSPWDETENFLTWEQDVDTPYLYLNDSSPMTRVDSCVSTPAPPPRSCSTASRRQLDPWICKVCGRWFTASYELEAHARSKSHATYTCDKLGCARKYCRRDSYVRHMATHHNSTKYQCSVCQEKSFKRKDHLLQHIRSAHAVETPQISSSGTTNGEVPALLLPPQYQPQLDGYGLSPLSELSEAPQPEATLETQHSIASLRKVLGDSHPAVRFIDEKLAHERSSIKAELVEIVSDLVHSQRSNLDSHTKREPATISPKLISSDTSSWSQ